MSIKKFNEFLKINELNSETYRSYADKVDKLYSKQKAIESAINVEYFGNPNYKPKPFVVKHKNITIDDIKGYEKTLKYVKDIIKPIEFRKQRVNKNKSQLLTKEILDNLIEDSSTITLSFPNVIKIYGYGNEAPVGFYVDGLKDIETEYISFEYVEWDGDGEISINYDSKLLGIYYPGYFIQVDVENGEIDISDMIENFECGDIELLLHNIFYGIVHDKDLMEEFIKNGVLPFKLNEGLPCIHFKGYENLEFVNYHLK